MKLSTKKRWNMLLRSSTHIILILFLSLLNCKGTSHKTTTSDNEKTTMDYEILLQDSHSNFAELTTFKITNTQRLQQVFNTINSTRKPGFPIPNVDFSNYDVAFFTTGELPTGGHTISVSEVIKGNDVIDIILEQTSPGPGEFAIMVITAPFIIIKFEKTELPINVSI